MDIGTEEIIFNRIAAGQIKVAAQRQERELQVLAEASDEALKKTRYLEAARDLVIKELALPAELREFVTVDDRRHGEYGLDHYAVLSVPDCAPIFVEFILDGEMPSRLHRNYWTIANARRTPGYYDEPSAIYEWTNANLHESIDIDIALAFAAESFIEHERIEEEIADEQAARAARAQANPVVEPTVAEQFLNLLNQIIDERMAVQA